GMVVFPIIAKPCAWDEHGWLKNMQVRPREAKPVWSVGGRSSEVELVDIVKEIKSIVNKTREENTKKIPFTNREIEIDRVVADYAPAYYLIDAPTGYGKTEFLKKVQSKFDENHWVSAIVTCDELTHPDNVADLVAEAFSVDLPNFAGFSSGVRLGSALQKKFGKLDEGFSGVVLLVDMDKKPSAEVIKELLQVVKSARELFGELSFFTKGHNRFRMVIAGRSLANLKAIRNSTLPFSVLKLSPFSYEVIKRAVDNARNSIDEKHRNNLSAHLFYATGGHPLCITKILKNYTNLPMLSTMFSEEQDMNIWNDIVKKVSEDVKHDFYRYPPELGVFSDWLGIFRYLDYYILKRLLLKSDLKISMDEYDFADSLTSTYMLDWDERVLKDDIARRLLAIGLRHTNKDFEKNCKEAQRICSDRLLLQNTHAPEKWFIEYLFQSLQMNAKIVFDKKKRTMLREQFFDGHLIKAWELFSSRCVINRGDIIVERRALANALESDWEFRFTVNYYLREDACDETQGQPFNLLCKRVDAFFDSIELPFL
ncbi:MAG: hypothetical protein DRG59_12565, partial [Deltaproteobacteria bacterium]